MSWWPESGVWLNVQCWSSRIRVGNHCCRSRLGSQGLRKSKKNLNAMLVALDKSIHQMQKFKCSGSHWYSKTHSFTGCWRTRPWPPPCTEPKHRLHNHTSLHVILEPTVASPRQEGHPVDGDGHGAVFVVEMVNVMGGAQTWRYSSGDRRTREGEQRQGQNQSP